MITRIELTNFMSHAHTVIEPAPGLTVLVGPNNCGKSAVVAALQILCHNENSTYVLRHGERECSVKVETDDGHAIEWRRKSAPSYRIDEQPFDRLGRNSVPDELHQALRMPRVGAGDDTDFDIHFGLQKSPIFLLGSSAANAARFFASSSDAIRLVQIQKRHKDKLAERQRQKNRLDAESKQLTAELESLQDVADLERRLCASEQLQQELTQLAARLEGMERAQAMLAAQQREVARHDERARSLAALAGPPELPSTEPLAKSIDCLLHAQGSQAQAAAKCEALAELPQPPAMFDVAALARAADGLTAHERLVACGQELSRALGALGPPPVLGDVAGLQRSLGGITAAQRQLAAAQARCRALASAPPPPQQGDEAELAAAIDSLSAAAAQASRYQRCVLALGCLGAPPVAHDTAPLEKSLQELQAAEARGALCRAALATASDELAAAVAAIHSFAASAVCPTCGGRFDADRLLTSAIAGGGGHDHD